MNTFVLTFKDYGAPWRTHLLKLMDLRAPGKVEAFCGLKTMSIEIEQLHSLEQVCTDCLDRAGVGK